MLSCWWYNKNNQEYSLQQNNNMLAANNIRKCGQCRMYGHSRKTCPNTAEALNALHEAGVNVGVAIYTRALNMCPMHNRMAMWETIPIDVRMHDDVLRMLPEAPVPRRALVFDAEVFINDHLNVVCKPDIEAGNCMVCLEDKHPNEWVEFGCGHGHCIACRQAMHYHMRVRCPYCTQQIQEVRVTNLQNLVGTNDAHYM